MTLSFLYWFFLLLILICGGWSGMGMPPPQRGPFWGWSFVTFAIFVIIGLRLFGGPIKG